jgi:antitoxin MazE
MGRGETESVRSETLDVRRNEPGLDDSRGLAVFGSATHLAGAWHTKAPAISANSFILTSAPGLCIFNVYTWRGTMETKVKKWGNSLAVRLSRHVVQESNIREGSRVGVEVDDGKIVLEVKGTKQYSLRKLLAKVTRKNAHGEFDLGKAKGKEIW